MNPSMIAAVMQPLGSGEMILEQVSVTAHLRGLCSETHMEQTYRNDESTPIEVVYTFPLPLDAVLLELTLELNGETLKGQISPKAEAEACYEEAIEQGDSAVLLRQVEPGLYSVNVGNLLPGERARIGYRFSQMLQWQGDSLRFQLPTTLAPRYGDPLKAGLQPHEIPAYSLTADHGFQLTLSVEGALSQADFDCPTHPLAVAQEGVNRVFRLSGGSALMDRDFVIQFRETDANAGEGYWAEDPLRAGEADGIVALAAFHPCYPGDNPPLHRTFKLVLDCSGSMGGDAMRQAKQAVSDILDSLVEADTFNLTAFGSDYQLLFPRPRPANQKNLEVARRFIEHIDANMGGTEVGAALKASYRAGELGDGQVITTTDLLLITDGEIWNSEEIIDEAKASRHRIFTVGVGSAVSEGFVRTIAQVTGGACELVSPREHMADHIVRHFRRIRQPVATRVDIDWPEAIKRQRPKRIASLYAGDTLHIHAWLDEPPEGPVTLRVEYEDGVTSEQRQPLRRANGTHASDLPRLVAQTRLDGMKPKKAQKLAVDYQLVSEYTSCVLVKTRDEDDKADEAPELRQIPHMLAAGWGGTGTLAAAPMAAGVALDCCAEPPAVFSSPKMRTPSSPSLVSDSDIEYLEIPSFMRRQSDDDSSQPDKKAGIIERIIRRRSDQKPRDTRAIDQIPGLPFSVLEDLKSYGITELQDLLDRSEADLLAFGFEAEDISLLIEALARWNLSLKQN